MSKLTINLPSRYLWLIVIIILALSVWFSLDFLKESSNKEGFQYLDPYIASKDIDDFLKIQRNLIVRYKPMKDDILKIIENTNGIYGVYFEDLQTGAWIGLNEREKFSSFSLAKVPVLVAALKLIEEGRLSFDQDVTISENELDYDSGSLAYMGAGYTTSLREILTFVINESDNTALNALRNMVPVEDFLKASIFMEVNLTYDSAGGVYYSPKDVSNMFRSLYYSTYLRRPYSNYALSLMALDTEYNWLKRDLPENVEVSHKYGIGTKYNVYNDCGIVYLGKKSYILCIMSKESTIKEAGEIIGNISKLVYGYIEHNT
jgi:beta-lactamase class A